MGQRTQIIHIIQDHKGELRQVDILHHQWGYGKVMPLALISYLTNQYNQALPEPKVKPLVGTDGKVVDGGYTANLHQFYDELAFQTDIANLTQAVRLPFVGQAGYTKVNGTTYDFIDVCEIVPENDRILWQAHAKTLLKTNLGNMAGLIDKFGLDNNNGYLVLVTTLIPYERWSNHFIITPVHTSLFIDEKGQPQSTLGYLAPYKGSQLLTDKAFTNLVAMLECNDIFSHREVMGVLNDDDCQLTTIANQHRFEPFTPANVLKLFSYS